MTDDNKSKRSVYWPTQFMRSGKTSHSNSRRSSVNSNNSSNTDNNNNHSSSSSLDQLPTCLPEIVIDNLRSSIDDCTNLKTNNDIENDLQNDYDNNIKGDITLTKTLSQKLYSTSQTTTKR